LTVSALMSINNPCFAAPDASTDVVLVVAIDPGPHHDPPPDTTHTKPRAETLDLLLHPFGHIEGGTIRGVAVRPHGVLPRRRARWVEEALLSDEDERTLGRRPARDLCFALGDLVERPAEMHRPCAETILRAPGRRAGAG